MDARRAVHGSINGAASVKALVGAFVESQGGFVRHKRGYFRHQPEVIQVVSLQWDSLRARYQFTVALFVRTTPYSWVTAREQVDTEFPQLHLCHLNLDLRDLIPDGYEAVEQVLRLPGELADAALTLAPLREFLHDRVASFLSKSSSLAGLRQLGSQGAFEGVWIHPELARDLR